MIEWQINISGFDSIYSYTVLNSLCYRKLESDMGCEDFVCTCSWTRPRGFTCGVWRTCLLVIRLKWKNSPELYLISHSNCSNYITQTLKFFNKNELIHCMKFLSLWIKGSIIEFWKIIYVFLRVCRSDAILYTHATGCVLGCHGKE